MRVGEFLDGLKLALEHEAEALDDDFAFGVVAGLHGDVMRRREAMR